MRPESTTGRTGRLVVLRHARSSWNALGRFTGSVDVGLAPDSGVEVESAARALRAAGTVPDLVVTSTLRRSIETAELIVERCGWTRVRITSVGDLDERDHGVLEGLTVAEAEARFGADAVLRWRRSADAGPPSGESFTDVLARVRECWTEVLLPALEHGAQVVVVGHGTSVRALLVAVGRMPPEVAARTEISTGRPVFIDWVPSAAPCRDSAKTDDGRRKPEGRF